MSDYYTEEAEYFHQKIEFEKSFEDAYGVTFDRIRELAEAEQKKKVIILNEIFETPRGDFGFIFYNEHNLLMGTFHPTREQADRALAEKGEADGK